MVNKNMLSKRPGVAPLDAPMAKIESLSKEEFAKILRWVSKKDWEHWDQETAADSEARKLDLLAREARDQKAKGTLRDL